MLAQTKPGAKGALLFHSCVPTSEFGGQWPHRVPLQIHMMDADEWVLPPTRPRHLFADNSLADYDEGAAALLRGHTLSFLENIK
jgi:hypothetical protein